MVRKWFRLVYLVTILLAAISFFSGFISVEVWSAAPFLSLVALPLALTLIPFGIIAVFNPRKNLWLLLSTLCLIWLVFSRHLAINLSVNTDKENSHRLLSHNLRAFGLNGPRFQVEDGHHIFNFLKIHPADIICFQEFFSTSDKRLSPVDSIRQVLFKYNEHIDYTIHFRKNDFGLATFSRYPILNKGRIVLSEKGTNHCIYSDILLGLDTVRFYNVHLESWPRPLSEEKESFDYSEFLQKALIAFRERERQADLIHSHQQSCHYPYITCGDFNDVPGSRTYRSFVNKSSDGHLKVGNGFGTTYIGSIPLLRIDYVLFSHGIIPISLVTNEVTLSDHKPLSFTFTVK